MAKRHLPVTLVDADFFDVIDTFAGQIAHDLGNLLMPMLTYPQLIRMDLPDNSDMAGLLGSIEKSADDMEHLARQLASLSNRQLGPKQELQLGAIVEDIIARAHASGALDRIRITRAGDFGDSQIMGHVELVTNTLQNLLDNAMEAMPDGGTLDISINRETIPEGALTVLGGETLGSGSYLKVVIRDSGPGMDDETLSHSPALFYTTKRGSSRRGAGLGLPIVYRSMRLHDGGMRMASQPSQGTAVELYFPSANA